MTTTLIDDVEAATTEASEAFAAFRATTPTQRADFLEAIAAEIEADKDAIIEAAVAESHLPLGRITGEVGRTTGQLRMFADVVRRGDHLGVRIDPAVPDRAPLPRADIRQRMIPLGPVAVFGASNFPLAFSTAGGDTASALAAGCPVVVKGHPAHPRTGRLVGRRHRPGGRGERPADRHLHLPPRRGRRLRARPGPRQRPAHQGRRLHRLARRRARDRGDGRQASRTDPGVRRDVLDQPRGRPPGRPRRAGRRRPRPGVRRLAHPRLRPVLHQPRTALPPDRRGGRRLPRGHGRGRRGHHGPDHAHPRHRRGLRPTAPAGSRAPPASPASALAPTVASTPPRRSSARPRPSCWPPRTAPSPTRSSVRPASSSATTAWTR